MPNRYTAAFADPKGAGDARPTSMDIVKDEGLIGKLEDKTMLVTGTSSGPERRLEARGIIETSFARMGIETVRALAATGATVYCTVRDMKKGEQALEGLLKPGKVELVLMDNNSLQTVREAAKIVLEKSGGKLNVIVNNAGIMTTPEGKTVDGFESQFGTNHLAHFLLFQLLKDALIKSSIPEFNSRVVNVASMGHKYGPVQFDDYSFATQPYNPMLAYGNSKTANIYMANQIDRLFASQGLHATSLHPGGVMTNLQQHTPQEVLDSYAARPEILNYMSNPAQGAATQVLAAVGREWEGKGGKYLEECDVARPEAEVPGGSGLKGYKDYAYNPEGEERLWNDSLKMVGLA